MNEIMAILIVKLSSFGDIVQSFSVLGAFEEREVDWVVDEKWASIVRAHPRVRRVFALPIGAAKRGRGGGALRRELREMRREVYEQVYDLQGNTKSGVVTALARGREKIGLGRKSVREWPNLLFTSKKVEVEKGENIRLQYLKVVGGVGTGKGVRLKTERRWELEEGKRVMVCPGSKWSNKRLRPDVLLSFLKEVGGRCYFVWGSETERLVCQELVNGLERAVLMEKLSIPDWQNLMGEMDLVVAVDSGALHLAGTAGVPTFSIFGPTASEVFKPLGKEHLAFQGKCPYGREFVKQCPVLRSCPTGACMAEVTAEELIKIYKPWWHQIETSRCAAPQGRSPDQSFPDPLL
jgi:heptosyltransferase-1